MSKQDWRYDHTGEPMAQAEIIRLVKAGLPGDLRDIGFSNEEVESAISALEDVTEEEKVMKTQDPILEINNTTILVISRNHTYWPYGYGDIKMLSCESFFDHHTTMEPLTIIFLCKYFNPNKSGLGVDKWNQEEFDKQKKEPKEEVTAQLC